MKNIFKLFSLIVVLLVTVVACEEETEWFGDYNGDGAVYAQFADTNWDFGLFLDAEGTPVTDEAFPIYVKLLGPAQSGDVTVGIKVTESTGASGEWSLSTMAITIPAGSMSGSAMLNIDKVAAVIDSTYTIELAIDEAATSIPVYGNAAATASVTVMKGLSCALDYTMFDGDYYHLTIFDYDPTPAAVVTPDADEATFSILTTWDEMGPTNFVLDIGDEIATNLFEISGENQLGVWSGDLTSWGLGANCRFDFEDFNGGGAKSCTGEFSTAFTAWILDVDAGSWYWWGGEMMLEFVPGTPGKKATTTITPVGGFTPELVKVNR